MISGILMPALDRTRSGIRFEAGSPTVQEPIPRMDVAAFIGFAERGPLHWPVVIEDMAQFEKVFGATPQLGWGQKKGERILGNLAESVSSFFIQGGQRCWIVRVAGAGAHSNQFVLPCLYKVTPSSGGYFTSPALTLARCEGSWSDQLHVATRLRTRHVHLGGISTSDSAQTWELRTRSDTVRPGDLLRIVREADRKQAFFPISKVGRDAVSGETVLYAQSAIALTKGDSANKIEPLGEPEKWKDGRTSVVSIDLRVRDNKSSEWCAENLGLTALHPRYCGALPTDIEVFRGDRSGSGTVRQTSSFGASNVPWFPLAAKADDIESATGSFMVPIDMDGNFGEESAVNASSSSALERDGLLNFDSNMFLDPALRATGLSDLMATADAVRYGAPQPRPLTGIHAVLGWFDTKVQDEVTLVAVPDAVHAPWQGSPPALSHSLTFEDLCAKEDTEKPESFADCHSLVAPSALEASLTPPPGTALHLSWRPGNSGSSAIEYQVQESASEEFLPVDNTWKTREKVLDIAINAPARRMFRVRAMSATQTSAWSGAIAVKILESERSTGPSRAAGPAIREIQQALVRLCAAQGELFSVLSLPRTMNEQDAANHVRTLSVVPVDGASAKNAHFDPEGRAGSYAAIYHPWIETRCTSGSVRPLPPDGAILGMIAARTRSRGAWIAPANQALRSVVALHTELPATRQAVLFDAGINVVLHRPEGYTLMSEDTLSGIPDQRPIHVRRLLILLRRMMLRLGEEFTFETNGNALRALIRQRCNNMLERLFRAGAFAGRSAAESFQVSVDDADNTLASVDAGRLIVRIRVRPAQALRFITLRFSLGGGTNGVSEGNAA
jgi:hypothetical protein